MTDSPRGAVRAAPTLLIALTVAVGLPCLRALFPVAYTYRETDGIAGVVVVALLVFLAPALVPVLVRVVRAPVLLAATTAALVVARGGLQALHPIRIGTAAAVAAVALVAIAVVMRPSPDGRVAALGLVGGLALDTAVRAGFATWDPVWQDGGAPVAVTVLLLVALVVVAGVTLRTTAPAEDRDRAGVLLALGPTLALQILFVQSLAAVAGAGDLSLAGATAVVLAADGLAALAVLALTAQPPARGATGAAAIVTAVVVGVLPAASGSRAIALTVLGQVLVVALFARAAASPAGPLRTGRAAAAAAAGSAAMGLTLLLYQLHYDRPLPFPNRWLLVGAAAVLGVAASLGRPTPAVAVPRRPLLVTGAVVALLAVAVVLGVAVATPDRATVAAGTTLRVATFNVHNGVTRDGQLDLEAVARHVEAVDADVVVMEEVDRGWLLAGTTDVAEWLSRRLDLPYEWAPAADGQMGNVVFHRVPLRNPQVVPLPAGAGTMDRSGLITTVDMATGEPLTVIGVHLQNGSSPAHLDTRIRETDVLLDAWDGAPRSVLLGDLNMDPGERDLRHLLAAGFTSAQPTDRCVMTTSNDNCVDWILVTEDLAQRGTRVHRVDEFDHDVVVSTVRAR